MTEFRPCPLYVGYSASLCGIIFRDRPRADGSSFDLNVRSGMVAIGNGPPAFPSIGWLPTLGARLRRRSQALGGTGRWRSWQGTIEFRPCPSYRGYSASACGVIRRDRPRKDGSLFIVGTTGKVPRVQLPCGKVYVATLVADAWRWAYPQCGRRPTPTCHDGEVLTVAEYRSRRAHDRRGYSLDWASALTDPSTSGR